MAYVSNDQLVREFIESHLTPGLALTHHWASTLQVSKDNTTLIYHRRGGHRRNEWGPVILCEWSEEKKLFVLNGDGFDDAAATRYQTNLRGIIQRLIQAEEQGREVQRWQVLNIEGDANGRRYVLIPFAALEASGISRDTIRPVVVQEDSFENIWHPVRKVPELPAEVPADGKKKLPEGWTEVQSTDNDRTFEVRIGRERYRVVAVRRSLYRNRRTRELRDYHFSGRRDEDWQPYVQWRVRENLFVWATPTTEGQVAGWQQIVRFDSRRGRRGLERVTLPDGTEPTDIPLDARGWYERVHHLGASIFTASNGNGSRRRAYLSAFDEQETVQRMYFLAQLPNGATPKTYREAIHALAPPIVHQAWRKRKRVRRQGDIFAIETKLTDKQVYADAITRVRRTVAMFNLDVAAVARAIASEQPLLEPAEGEVRERALCLCGCGHKRWIGCGPKAKRALSIYRTGHTADEVVVTKRGTFIRGTMHHDPSIEEPGRRPEHQTVQLGQKWHLAVRNTVPRSRRRNNPPAEGS